MPEELKEPPIEKARDLAGARGVLLLLEATGHSRAPGAGEHDIGLAAVVQQNSRPNVSSIRHREGARGVDRIGSAEIVWCNYSAGTGGRFGRKPARAVEFDAPESREQGG